MKEIPSVEEMYQHFLSKIGIDPVEISKEEDRERRITFYGGISTMIKVMFDQISELPDKQANEALNKIVRECEDFWTPFLKQ